jgi:uncharacterized membrane protein YccC
MMIRSHPAGQLVAKVRERIQIMRLRWPQIADPDLHSLKSAVRAAIVMPAVFAVASQLIKEPQAALFASFGSFAMLVLVDFSGPPKSRFLAYLTLGVSGAALVVVGSLCSRNVWLATAAMAVVGFGILFSGVINGYFAAGGTAAVLAFVLSVAIPAPVSAIGWRLAGWGLAAGAGICAVMLIWPPRRGGNLRRDAAKACRVLADVADSVFAGDEEAARERARAARAATDELRNRLAATPHRPTGPTEQAAALAGLIDELGWLVRSLGAVTATQGAELCRRENGESMAAAATVLRASSARLAGQDDRPDTGRLDRAQQAAALALARRVSELPAVGDDQAVEALLERWFRTRLIAFGAWQIAGYALTATGGTEPSADGPAARAAAGGSPLADAAQRLALWPAALLAVRRFTAEHVSARSVWFRNSIRGAAGLAVAVFIAQRSGLQHSFWVVLGTLSVLRSTALSTGKSVLSALAGTAVGIIVGAVILLAVGDSDAVLWGLLPVAVLVAAYAPRVISFAAGQAAFTLVLVILFNIIQPVGWKVGLIRIEDVAIGFAVSLGVGLVFWPRGAATMVREHLATAYSRSADYVSVTARLLAGTGDDSDPGRAELAATAAIHQLDDAFRQYLAERSAKRTNPESTARLVAGAARVLRAGLSMAALTGVPGDGNGHGPHAGGLRRFGEDLDGQVQAVRSWYVTLGDSLVHGTSVPPPQPATLQNHQRLLRYLRDFGASGDAADLNEALLMLWASQHLDMLRRLEAHLGEQAVVASSLLPGGSAAG